MRLGGIIEGEYSISVNKKTLDRDFEGRFIGHRLRSDFKEGGVMEEVSMKEDLFRLTLDVILCL